MVYGIIIGLIAGYIASRLQKGKSSGCLVNLFLGVVGGFVGSWIFSLFGVTAYSWVGELVTAVIGAMLLLWLFKKLR